MSINAETMQEQEDLAPPRFVVIDQAEFDNIVSTEEKVEKLAGDMGFTEDPVWMPVVGCLLFSDIPADEIKQWQNGKVTTFRKPSRHTNGNLLDEKGRLISCEHGYCRVTRTLKDGSIVTVADQYRGKKLNSPTSHSGLSCKRASEPSGYDPRLTRTDVSPANSRCAG